MQYLTKKRETREQRLLRLVSRPSVRKQHLDDDYYTYVENARRFLSAHVDEMLNMKPCPRFVAVSGDKIFYGELDNEVSYHWVTEGTTPGMLLDLDPGFVDTRF